MFDSSQDYQCGGHHVCECVCVRGRCPLSHAITKIVCVLLSVHVCEVICSQSTQCGPLQWFLQPATVDMFLKQQKKTNNIVVTDRKGSSPVFTDSFQSRPNGKELTDHWFPEIQRAAFVSRMRLDYREAWTFARTTAAVIWQKLCSQILLHTRQLTATQQWS